MSPKPGVKQRLALPDTLALLASHTIELCPLLRLWHARSIVIILEEQAVLTCMLGPLRSKYQLSRFAWILGLVEVANIFAAVSGSLAVIIM